MILKAKKDVILQVTSKLQSSKNVFSRGDFDDYKISDDELNNHCDEIKKGMEWKLVVPSDGRKPYMQRFRYRDKLGYNYGVKSGVEYIKDIPEKKFTRYKIVESNKVLNDLEFYKFAKELYKDPSNRNLPVAVKLPTFNTELSKVLNIENHTHFIFNTKYFHVSPQRKSKENPPQDLSLLEFASIPRKIRNANFVLVDKEKGNFNLIYNSFTDKDKCIFVVFNKDSKRKNVYSINISKKYKQSINKNRYAVVGVGFLPTISSLNKSYPALYLPTSLQLHLSSNVSHLNNLSTINIQKSLDTVNEILIDFNSHKTSNKSDMERLDEIIHTFRGK